jgi:pimeloyl-ACP methyl ester carboxylesterase
MIEDAALWLAGNAVLAPRGRIAIAGVSFAGGLALVAAGRPSLRGRLDRVVALGAHADLPRVMAFLCTGVLPHASQRRPHDYGVAVVLLGALPALVPPAQVAAAQDATVKFLDASSIDRSDPERAAPLFEDARVAAEALVQPSRSLLLLVNERNTAALGARLAPQLEPLGGDPALSPERSPATHAPVFLVHGHDDSVIPSSESTALAAYLRQHGNTNVQVLLTPALSHVDVKPPRLADAWRLIRFWKEVLE